ncbi:cuticle protein 10.9-like [Dermacentor andersoni]|uniref:cuticle protein 10.9-like n=1 Tax=Dermacentor andersoni TaxID=34620 RepID=UPI0021557B72|nr:cuticle protein 10.9-like [Dermacentor andersoni]
MIAQVTFALLVGYASCLATHYGVGAGHYGGGAFGYGGGLIAAPAVVKAIAAEPAYPPQPYEFGYDTVDEFGTRLTRQESSDSANQKKGSYGYTDANGIYRQVNYVADAGGFRATISTNEPGTAPGETGGAVYDAKPVAVVDKHHHVKAAAAILAPTYAVHPGYFGKY